MSEVPDFEILYYATTTGKFPFLDWMSALKDGRGKNAVEQRIIRLQEGNLGDCKHFDDLMEMRIDYGPGYRIYCGKEGKAFVIILVGGSKQTQGRDIEKAKGYWADYKKRTSRGRALRELPLPRPKG
jgi:putative addiction module killer protein